MPAFSFSPNLKDVNTGKVGPEKYIKIMKGARKETPRWRATVDGHPLVSEGCHFRSFKIKSEKCLWKKTQVIQDD